MKRYDKIWEEMIRLDRETFKDDKEPSGMPYDMRLHWWDSKEDQDKSRINK